MSCIALWPASKRPWLGFALTSTLPLLWNYRWKRGKTDMMMKAHAAEGVLLGRESSGCVASTLNSLNLFMWLLEQMQQSKSHNTIIQISKLLIHVLLHYSLNYGSSWFRCRRIWIQSFTVRSSIYMYIQDYASWAYIRILSYTSAISDSILYINQQRVVRFEINW